MDDDLRKYVRKHGNLTKAWHAVRANSRFSTSPYVKEEAADFSGDEQKRIASIAAKIHHGTFRFSASRGVAIEKKGKPGKVRPIVISKVQDRIVQRCVLDALTAHDEIRAQAFQPYSFGGIPKSSKNSLAGVPAAIHQLIEFAREGRTHVMIADIEGFFTKISKASCLDLIKRFTDDCHFLSLFERSIAVDLENAAKLWRHKEQFPYGDLGVAQGSCLSPFLGNLILSDFDQAMNDGDCRCIRYIDDVIIVAPSGRAASSRFRMASRILGAMGMNFAPDKSSPVPIPLDQSFEYLGIEFSAEGLRPSKKSRQSIVARCSDVAAESLLKIRKSSESSLFDMQYRIPRTLNRISGMAKGWAHHYSFCDDKNTIMSIDRNIMSIYVDYKNKASELSKGKEPKMAAVILGYRGASEVDYASSVWPLKV